MHYRNVIFARVGHMHYYSGVQKGDEKPQHGGAYNIDKIGHELYNFKPIGDKIFGYFQPFEPPEDSSNPVTVNIERIDPIKKGNDLITNVLVIFVSKKTGYGQIIVGWYKNATVFRQYQPPKKTMLRDKFRYNLQAEIKNSVLLPEDYRKSRIPTGGGAFGRANVVYLFGKRGRVCC